MVSVIEGVGVGVTESVVVTERLHVGKRFHGMEMIEESSQIYPLHVLLREFSPNFISTPGNLKNFPQFSFLPRVPG